MCVCVCVCVCVCACVCCGVRASVAYKGVCGVCVHVCEREQCVCVCVCVSQLKIPSAHGNKNWVVPGSAGREKEEAWVGVCLCLGILTANLCLLWKQVGAETGEILRRSSVGETLPRVRVNRQPPSEPKHSTRLRGPGGLHTRLCPLSACSLHCVNITVVDTTDQNQLVQFFCSLFRAQKTGQTRTKLSKQRAQVQTLTTLQHEQRNSNAEGGFGVGWGVCLVTRLESGSVFIEATGQRNRTCVDPVQIEVVPLQPVVQPDFSDTPPPKPPAPHDNISWIPMMFGVFDPCQDI